jgi:hypothetical protein
MSGQFVIAVFYYGAGLLFWPVFQVLHRRWSRKAKRLLAVFLSNLAVVVLLGGFFLVMWSRQYFNHNQLPLLLLFPALNLASLLISCLIAMEGSHVG